MQLASAPSDLSITELEIRQFEALYPDDMNQRAVCYFRDPAVLQYAPFLSSSEPYINHINWLNWLTISLKLILLGTNSSIFFLGLL